MLQRNLTHHRKLNKFDAIYHYFNDGRAVHQSLLALVQIVGLIATVFTEAAVHTTVFSPELHMLRSRRGPHRFKGYNSYRTNCLEIASCTGRRGGTQISDTVSTIGTERLCVGPATQ